MPDHRLIFANGTLALREVSYDNEPVVSDPLYLACPHCHVVNRVPEANLVQAANSGQCHKPLFTAYPLDLTAATFAMHIERSDIPVLVDFWAPWCAACKMMAPQFVQAAGMLEPRVRLAKVDTEAERTLGIQYGIRSVPTLVLFKGGHEVARHAKAMGALDIVRWVTARL